MRNNRIANIVLALMLIVSLVAMPVTAYAQETPLPDETAYVLNWDDVVQMAAQVQNFVPGRPSGNPGPLIAALDNEVGVMKNEFLTEGSNQIVGPALYWGGIYDNDASLAIMEAGAKVVSCRGSRYELGTCILAVPQGVTITVPGTGAWVPLEGFNASNMPKRGPMMIADVPVAFPAECIDAELSSSVTTLDAIAESAGPLTKAFGRDHIRTRHIMQIPEGMFLLFWTTSPVTGGQVVAFDPGTAVIYKSIGTLLVIGGSFQGYAMCGDLVTETATTNASGTMTTTVSQAEVVPVVEVAKVLNDGTKLGAIAEQYPMALVDQTFEGKEIATVFLISESAPGSEWMSVSEGGQGPGYINLTDTGTVPDGAIGLKLDMGFDAECLLDYWLDVKPERCTVATE